MPKSYLSSAIRIVLANIYVAVLILSQGFLPEVASFAGFITFPLMFVVGLVAAAYRYWGKMALLAIISFPVWTGGFLLWNRTGTYFFGGIVFLVVFVPFLYYFFLILEREPPPEMTSEAIAGRRLYLAVWTFIVGLSCLVVGTLFYVLLGFWWPLLVMVVALGILPILTALLLAWWTGKQHKHP